MIPIAFHPNYHLPLPANHRFPMEKYSLLPEQLIYEGTCKENQFFTPGICDEHTLKLTHDASYLTQLLEKSLSPQMMRRIGFPMSDALLQRELTLVQGTIDASRKAIQTQIAFNIAGGTHHAFSDKGEGFCLLNDNAIAANLLLAEKLAKKILIVDLDVHQGNGTAQIFKNSQDVFTFSMHGKNNFPFEKENSTLDIALEDGTDDATYLKILKETLPKILDSFQPDFIFYQAGVDILDVDKMGKMSCTLEGCKNRDLLILQNANLYKIPIVINMGGGYAPNIKTIIEAHANTFRIAMDLYS